MIKIKVDMNNKLKESKKHKLTINLGINYGISYLKWDCISISLRSWCSTLHSCN